MQLVKCLRVTAMHWQHAGGCTLTLCATDVHREDRGKHWLSRTWAESAGIPLDPSLFGRDLAYTLSHRMLVGKILPAPSPRLTGEPTEWIIFHDAVQELDEQTVLLKEVRRAERWNWTPDGGVVEGESLRHHGQCLLDVCSGGDWEDPPSCALTLELTEAEFAACIQLLPGSVFDLTLRLLPAAVPAMS